MCLDIFRAKLLANSFLSFASVAVAFLTSDAVLAQTSIEETKAALSAATTTLASSQAKPDQITKELTALKAQIAEMEERSAPEALRADAASVLTLVELLRYARTDSNVIDAIADLRSALAIYDAPDPVGTLAVLRTRIESLDPDKTVPPTATGVQEALVKILEEALALEAKLPNAAAVARAKHLADLIESQKSALLQSSVSTAFETLAMALPPLIYRKPAEAAGAQIDALEGTLTELNDEANENLVTAKGDKLRSLAVKIDKVLGTADPRLVIVSARFGDFRPGVDIGRTCNATAQVRSKCTGKNSCVLEAEFSDADKLCGYNPAPTAPEGALTLRASYGCEAATRAEWLALMAYPGTLSDDRAPTQRIYPGPLGTIACAPNRPSVLE
ncbi:hypothetical protein MED193_16954 [Roseobacter sp. MED193]|uniref:hypothetical protein n=1 Tax=Roseobacter sp. MED193 TaxID=314262 RepID=UPI000068B8BA|nr:hypothetical protein [Roseobacter sp. MED193]EAQ46902.1 hypothetical protein MED193_16954 [Roseobacter sp. MED193]